MSFDLSTVLHAGRSALLARTRATGRVVVSVGAAGQWYFDWIDASCGVPARHIGVEFYNPEPPKLPSYVEWVSNTAADMSDVSTGVADILISGQNIEHLWDEDVAGFLAEAYRVLKPGGIMVIDSPNRAVTEIYGGAHPEHMVELTVPEAVALFSAAGFDVRRLDGLLLCRDPRSGEPLPIEGLSETSEPSLVFRSIAGLDDAENAYLWWMELIRTDRAPDPERVRKIISKYWAIGWPERMNRLVTGIGAAYVSADGRQAWKSEPEQSGPLCFGPYAPLKAGRYRTTLNVMRLTECRPESVLGHVDVIYEDGPRTDVRRELTGADLPLGVWTPLPLEFEIDALKFGFQNRLFTYGEAGLAVERRLEFQSI